MNKLLTLLIFIISTNAFATVHVSTITADQIDSFRIHTTKHYNGNTFNIATIRSSALLGSCSRGVFVDAESDKAAYSAIMAAYMAGRDMEIRYDSGITSPWGDVNYCAIIHFDIK